MEYEKTMTLFHIQRIADMQWDALGEALVLLLEVGPTDGSRRMPMAISIDPVAAEVLLDVLPQALAGRPGEEPPRQ